MSDVELLIVVVAGFLFPVLMAVVMVITSGRLLATVERTVSQITMNKALTKGLESRINEWSPERRRLFNTILDVVDRVDLPGEGDDLLKAWARELLDGDLSGTEPKSVSQFAHEAESWDPSTGEAPHGK